MRRWASRSISQGDVAIFAVGATSFIRQRYHEETRAKNTMMQVLVDDLDDWWERVVSLDLPETFDVTPPKPTRIAALGVAGGLRLRSGGRPLALRRAPARPPRRLDLGARLARRRASLLAPFRASRPPSAAAVQQGQRSPHENRSHPHPAGQGFRRRRGRQLPPVFGRRRLRCATCATSSSCWRRARRRTTASRSASRAPSSRRRSARCPRT